MRYSTGNPVEPDGSSDPRDLYDNAGIADLLINGPLGEYLSRLGVPLKSWRGIMQQVTDYLIAQGYESTYLVYGAGVVVQRQTQLVQRAGELYRVMNASDIPLTLTETWATDAPKLQAVGDIALRQALATTDGSSLIGTPSGTVEDRLSSIAVDITEATAEIARTFKVSSAVENISPQKISMHYGACKGTGFASGVELGGVTTATVTVAAASDVNRLYLSSTVNFFSNQLIVYQGTDGEYYSAVVLNKDAASILLRTNTESALAVGGLIANFYANESHANTYGYYAIADYALRTANDVREVMRAWKATDGAVVVGASTLSSYTTLSYDNSGSTTQSAIRSIAAGAGSGLATPFYDLPAGNYIAKFSLTPNMIGSADISVPASLSVVERTAVADTTIQVASPRGQTALTVELPFSKRSDSTVSFRMLNQNAGNLFSNISKIEILRVKDAVRTLNKGKHVLLGDSWFAFSDIQNRLAARLPNATIIGKGVGGNTAAQLVARFAADVAPEDPDFVWVMCGTNDVAQNVPFNTFNYNIGLLKSRICNLGARSILFDCSVGPAAHSVLGDLLTNSRNYALNTDYLDDGDTRRLLESKVETFRNSFQMTINAGVTARVCVFPGTTNVGAILDRLMVVGQFGSVVGSGNYRVGYGASPSSTISEDLISSALTASVVTGMAVPKSNATPRFLLIEVQNTSGAAIAITGFVAGNWTPA